MPTTNPETNAPTEFDKELDELLIKYDENRFINGEINNRKFTKEAIKQTAAKHVIGEDWKLPMTHEKFDHQFLADRKIESDLRSNQRQSLWGNK